MPLFMAIVAASTLGMAVRESLVGAFGTWLSAVFGLAIWAATFTAVRHLLESLKDSAH